MITQSKSFKILIVDDDKIIRAMLRSVFKDSKYFIVEADSGEMALEILPDVMPDLVLLDILMTGIDGLEVLRQIRADERLKFVKVILLSSRSDVQERLQGYELGTDDYLSKPFVGGELRAKVDVFIRINDIENKNINLEERVKKEVTRQHEQEKYLASRAKLISMGEMVSAIGHHWRQPLNALGLTIQDIYDAYQHDELTDDYIRRSVDKSMRHISFMSEIIDNFQEIMREDTSEDLFSVTETLYDVVTLVSDRVKSENISLTINGINPEEHNKLVTSPYFVKGRDWIYKQALSGIIANSIDAISSRKSQETISGKIKIKIWHTDELIITTITDNGGGIKKDPDRVFEPYYTTKDQGKGVGLGLYFTRILIEKQLSGRIFFKNIDDLACFTIELPFKN